jgi:hypothetical protein
MASSVIGSLRVNLGLNSAAFSSGLKKSESSVKAFAKGAAIGFAALTAVATSAFASVISTAKDADKSIKMARGLGTSVENFSALSHAADMSGASVETLAQGMRRVSQIVTQKSQGMKNEGTDAFDRLGISLKNSDGSLRDIGSVINDVANKFKNMPDGVEKTANAMGIFGDSGSNLISMLNQGADGIEAMKKEAKSLGIVFSTESAQSAENFNDNISRLSKTFEGFRTKLFNAFIPVLERLSSKLVEIVRNGPKLDGLFKEIGAAMEIAGNGVLFVFNHLKDLYDLFKIWVMAQSITFIASLAGSFLTLASSIRQAGLIMTVVTKITRAKITAIILLAAAVAKLTGTYDDIENWVKKLGKSIMAALPESLKDNVEVLGDAVKHLGAEIAGTDESAAKSMGTYINAANAAKASFKNVGDKINEMKEGLVSSEEEGNKFGDSLREKFSSIGEGIRGLIDGTATWRDVLKSALGSFAKIAFNKLSNSLGIGGNIGAAGNGGGIFSNIIGGFFSGLTKFKSGGSFRVGGAGLTDSQLVAFRADPNEVVNVMTPQQQRDSRSRNGSNTNFNQTNQITIHTPDVNGFKASESQIAARLALMTQQGMRNL